MQPGERRIVWAYHHTSDFIDDNWQKHKEKGFVKVALLKEPKPPAIYEFIDPRAVMIAASSGVGNLLLIVTVTVFCSFSFVV